MVEPSTENRGQKRSEMGEELPADKRACSSLEFKPSSSSASPQTLAGSSSLALETNEGDMETSSSSASASGRSEGDAEKDSPYGSCDSDNDGYHRYSSLREFQRRRSYGYSAKFNRILASLSDEVEPSEQLAALTELCEVLSFSTEDSISSMIADQLAPVLVKLAKHESSPDTMLLAIRAMTYLCDILPRSSGFLVRHDAVPALCQRLMVIEYLDVAEQCLQALEKISRDQPLACLQSGAIMAVLNYIDFFSTTVQRTALSTVVNICKKLPSECPSPFMEAVPRLCSLLQYEDRQLVEHVATCLIKIADRVKDSPDMLDQLCAHGLIHQAVNLVDMNGRTTVSQSIRTNVIELLAKLTSLSADAVKTLFELNIGGVLKDLLLNYDIAHGMPSPRSLDKNCIQVHEVLKLLNELLTSLGKNHKDQPSLTEEKVSVEAADILLNFGMDILPTLIQVVNSGANLFVCYGCLSVINKLVRFSSPGHLHELVKSTNIASFLAGVFTRSDPHILLLALQITQTVLQKLSDVLMDSFIKEGVLFAIDAILVPVKTSQLTFTMANGIHTSFDMGQKFSGRCMCYAYELVLTSDSGSCKVDKDVVHTLAEQVKADYFIAGLHNPQSIVTDILQNLKDAATELTDLVKISLGDDAIDDYEEKFHSVLHQFTIQLSGHEPISTFELMESGIIRALVNYFSNGQYLEEKIGISDALTHLYEVQKRFQTFARVSLSSPDPLSQELPLSLLVRKLQSALSTVENFPVILGNMVRLRGSYSTVPNGSYTMHSCFRVRFLRGEDETSLSDYSGDVVSVDPFCSVEAIEKYLWPKVSKRSTEYSESAVQASRKPKVIPLEVAVGSSLQGKSSDPTGSDGICSILPEMQETMVHRSSGLSTEAVGSSQAQIDEAKFSNRAFPGCIERDLCLSSDDNADMKVDSNKLASTSSSSAGLEKDGRRIPSCGAKNDGAKLSFYLEGTELDPSSSLYQQIIQQQMNSGQEFCSSAKLWSETYTLSYKMAANTDKCCSKSQSDICSSYKLVRHTPLVPVLDGTVAPRPFSGLEKSSPVNDVLFLLRSLEMMNRFMIHLLSHERLNAFAEGKTDSLDSLRVTVPALPQNNFVNSKLTEKLEQQLRDPLAVCVGAMPLWCNELMSLCPFLFSFEARCKFFHLAAFGRLHGQCHLSPHTASDVATERRSATGALPRKKFVVSRDRVLFSAAQMMDLHARQKVALEVEYNEEVGTGLGPTLEFYTLVCHEFQKADLGMWRLNHISSNNGNSVLLPFGLFPRPWSLTSSTSGGIEFSYVLKKFVLLGQIVGKALQDGRVLDLPFSKAFYKLILGKDLTIYDIQSFDPELGRALLEFQAIVDRQQYLKSTRGENCTFEVDATFRNTKIEDLCLDFTLPGYPDFVLASGLNYMTVNINNIKAYISLVLDATLYTGISRQVEAFKSGLSQVFPIKHLQIFTEEELERLLCGEHDSWASNELLDHIKFDHGYNSMSPPIINLLEIIREFDYNQRRAFLQFVTGAPRLPPGGLAALSPKLTIVRKHSGNGADADLPSVMTCANYLKLPPYSSKERMKEKLLYAITEGQGSFHLS